MRGQRAGSWALVVLSAVLAVGTTIAWWASGLADAETFAAQATSALQQDDVNELVAERLVDRYAGDTVLGTSARPAAVGLTQDILASDAFAGVFQAAVRTAHEQLVSDRDDSVTVAVAGAAPVLEAALAPDGSAEAAGPDSGIVAVVNDPTLVRAAHLLSLMRPAAWIGAALWLLTCAGAILLAQDRRRTLRRLGSGLLVAGVVLVAAVLVTRTVVGRGEPADVHAAAGDLVTVFTVTLLQFAQLLVVVGAVVGICAVSAVPTGTAMMREGLALARRTAERREVRAAMTVATPLLGVLLVLDPAGTLTVLAHGAGLVLVVAGTLNLLGALVRAIDRGRATGPAAAATRTMGVTALTTVVAVALAVTALGAVAGSDVTPALPAPDPDRAGCNGVVGLCGLRLDQIALTGSHNSMSSTAERGWYLGEQRLTISRQLAAGVHALMLDVYPGYVSEGRVRTDLRAPATADAAEADLTDEGREQLEHLGVTVGAIPPEGAEIKAYLCHAYCELGASEMVEKLRDVGDFLDHNPEQVVVMVLQDYITGQQTQEVFDEAGLQDRVWPLAPTDPFPTLRQMIESGRTVVVLSENHGGEVPWMPAAYDVMEETPYEFASPEDFSCVPNRGGTGKPVFLVNHWIREPGHDPLSDAADINSRAALTERLDECQQVRGRQPGILAVDFVDIGDTMAVVGDINDALADP